MNKMRSVCQDLYRMPFSASLFLFSSVLIFQIHELCVHVCVRTIQSIVIIYRSRTNFTQHNSFQSATNTKFVVCYRTINVYDNNRIVHCALCICLQSSLLICQALHFVTPFLAFHHLTVGVHWCTSHLTFPIEFIHRNWKRMTADGSWLKAMETSFQRDCQSLFWSFVQVIFKWNFTSNVLLLSRATANYTIDRTLSHPSDALLSDSW